MDREPTLAERVRNLEINHEETRSRLTALIESVRHERERIDTILGSEPQVVEAQPKDYASSR